MNGAKKKGQFQEATPELPRATHKSENWLMRSDDESEICKREPSEDSFVYANHFTLSALLSHTFSFKRNILTQKLPAANETKKPHQLLGEAHKSSSWFAAERRCIRHMSMLLPLSFMCISFFGRQEKKTEIPHDRRHC